MPIALETERRGGGGAQVDGRRRSHAQAAAAAAGSSSSGRGSGSRAAVMQCGEGDDGDGEVESSYRGPLDTMDTLQDALPSNNRRLVSKFYNGKSSPVADVVSSPQPTKDVAHPANPSPKKRKGLLPFSFSWGKSRSRSKESSSRGNATNSPKSCRKTLSPPATSCAAGNSQSDNSQSDNERGFFQDPPRRSLQIGHSAALGSQLISVQMKSVSVAALEDVTESTTSISPREKRRKSLE